MRQPSRSPVASSLMLVSALFAIPQPAAAQAGVRPLAPYEARVVDFAREGAMRRLRAAECRQVLSDFKDPQGRTPLDNLQPFAMEPDEFLALIPFLDGRTRPLCQANQSQLLTTRGVVRVFVCKSFLQTVQQERDLAEIYVIHEMLHTLGLDENPPSSHEITQQVKRRCGL